MRRMSKRACRKTSRHLPGQKAARLSLVTRLAIGVGIEGPTCSVNLVEGFAATLKGRRRRKRLPPPREELRGRPKKSKAVRPDNGRVILAKASSSILPWKIQTSGRRTADVCALCDTGVAREMYFSREFQEGVSYRVYERVYEISLRRSNLAMTETDHRLSNRVFGVIRTVLALFRVKFLSDL
jgi:hypothetical protein